MKSTTVLEKFKFVYIITFIIDFKSLRQSFIARDINIHTTHNQSNQKPEMEALAAEIQHRMESEVADIKKIENGK